MVKRLLLVDLENRPKIDLSLLDETYRAIIYVGANQNPPKAAFKKTTAHRFQRVDFQKIEGTGKNALDFHIAFQLGRVIETEPNTECIVLSGDGGFDPLLGHLNRNGLVCRRVNTMADLLVRLEVTEPAMVGDPELTVCPKCHKTSTIEHHGGRWCSNCGFFAVRPDPSQLPSSAPEYREPPRPPSPWVIRSSIPRRSAPAERGAQAKHSSGLPTCAWCHQQKDMSTGSYDDGEWMCGDCVSRLSR